MDPKQTKAYEREIAIFIAWFCSLSVTYILLHVIFGWDKILSGIISIIASMTLTDRLCRVLYK